MTDALAHLADYLARQPRTAADAWLHAGLRKWTKDGGSLEAALGLTPAARVRRRDNALRTAADLLAAGRDLSAWDAAGVLALKLKRFCAVKLPLHRRGLAGELDEIERHLLASCESGARPVTSRRHLFRILQ